MPWLLYRSMLADVLRVLVLTTAVLVTVIAFGAAIKPLAKGSLLDAGQTLKYIVLAIVPMLQFAVPFAAGFAGTLSMHRMASENELVAAAASGISYRRLLAPIVALGLALTIVMLLLTQWIIPRFWGLLERTVTQDVTRLFQAPIERGEPFQLGDWQIYADRLVVDPNPSDTGADSRLMLYRVVVADLDDEGRIVTDVTANQVVADVYRRPGGTFVKLVMLDTVVSQPESGTLSWSPRIEPPARVIPALLEDDPLRMTRSELLELRDDPDAFGPILEARIALAAALRDAALWGRVDTHLRDGGSLALATQRREPVTYRVRADRLDAGVFIRDDGERVEVIEIEGQRERRRFDAGVARLERRPGEPLGAVTFDLQLEEVTVTDLAFPDAPNERERVPLENLVLPAFGTPVLAERPSRELLAEAAALRENATLVTQRAARLEHKITKLQNEVTGRLRKRWTLSVTALLLLLLGSTLAMWRRNSLPLTIYLWAFVPSLVDLMVISSGEHMIRDGQHLAGTVVMWAGNAGLLVMLGVAYFKLSRN